MEVFLVHLSVAVAAHLHNLAVKLDGAVAQLSDLSAQYVAVKAILVWRILVGVKGYGPVDLAVVEITDVALLVWLVIFIEQLLHLEKRKWVLIPWVLTYKWLNVIIAQLCNDAKDISLKT